MATFLTTRDNNALDVNPPDADRHLTTHGSDWLWAVTAVQGLALLSWLVWTLMRNKTTKGSTYRTKSSKHNENHDANNDTHRSIGTDASPVYLERIFHYLWSIAAFITFIAYFAMASDLGSTPVRQYKNHGANTNQTRQVFYARYIYYFTAWPLIVTANLLLSGVSWATILFAIALQEIWVVSWLCGALVSTSYKWGFYAFGTFAYLVLSYVMLSWGIEHARRIYTKKDYTLLAGLLVIVWIGYPIAWGLSEGSNKLSVTGEMIFYGILDLIAVPIYGTLFLILASKRFVPALFQYTQVGRVSALDETAGHHLNALTTPGAV